MKRLISFLFILGISFQFSQAQTADIIVTRGGDIYEGYISNQVPGRSLTIETVKTIVTASSSDVKKMSGYKVRLDNLPADRVQLFPLLSADSYVEIADIKVTDEKGGERFFNEAIILESGEDTKFVCFSPGSYDLDWSDIMVSGKAPYVFSEQSGLYDKIKLTDGSTVEGQLMEQNLISDMIKFRTLEGSILTFRKSNLESLESGMRSQKGLEWSKIPYCDRIILRDGMSEDGFIVAKSFGENVTIQRFNSDSLKVYPIQDIASYRKYPNQLYNTSVPEVTSEPEQLDSPAANLFVNGKSYSLNKLLTDRGSFYVDSSVSSLSIVARKRENIVIKYRVSARTSQIKVAKAKQVKRRRSDITSLYSSGDSASLWPVFDKSDILASPDINIQSNDGECIVADISFVDPGVYVIWINGNKECIAINVN